MLVSHPVWIGGGNEGLMDEGGGQAHRSTMKLFSLKGRIGRAQYSRHFLIELCLYLLFAVAALGTDLVWGRGNASPRWVETLLLVLFLVFLVVSTVVMIGMTVRRLHDLDRSGSHFFAMLLPIYDVYLGLILLFQPGTAGPNRYGDGPRAEDSTSGRILLLPGVAVVVEVGILVSLFVMAVAPIVMVATDGQSQVTVPGTWRNMPELHQKAELRAGNPRKAQYLIVLTESKADFTDMTLDAYAQLVVNDMAATLEQPTVSDSRSLTIDGKTALQQEVRGATDRLDVVFLVTCVEGTRNYYQVLAWTPLSTAHDNGPTLLATVESFREIVP